MAGIVIKFQLNYWNANTYASTQGIEIKFIENTSGCIVETVFADDQYQEYDYWIGEARSDL